MSKEDLAKLLRGLKAEEIRDLQEFKEASWGDNNVDDTADGAFGIGYDEGFNQGIETAIAYMEKSHE